VTALPAAWQKAIDESAVETGGVSNVPMAVGRRGEVAVARDDGDTRDLLLINSDKSVTEIYPVPEPDQNQIGSVAMDDRWVVVGVQNAPRGTNGARRTASSTRHSIAVGKRPTPTRNPRRVGQSLSSSGTMPMLYPN